MVAALKEGEAAMIWLYIYVVGVMMSAAIIGAFALPASANHKGHPADDPAIFVVGAFLWPLVAFCIPVAVLLWGSAALGAWAIGRQR